MSGILIHNLQILIDNLKMKHEDAQIVYQAMEELKQLTTLRASHTLLVEMLKGIRSARKRRGYDVRMIDELLRNAEEVAND